MRMTESPPQSKKGRARIERERRLAEALRANLKRRKAAAHVAPEPEAAPPAEAGEPDLE
jgi:hypothetical protein